MLEFIIHIVAIAIITYYYDLWKWSSSDHPSAPEKVNVVKT